MCAGAHGILFDHKEDEIVNFVHKWIVLENIILNEGARTQKNKLFMFPCGS